MKRKIRYHLHYTMIDELMASPAEPIDPEKRKKHMAVIFKACDLLTGGVASKEDWRIVSDVVNMIETLTTHAGGHWPDCDGDLVHMKDDTGLLMAAITAMALAGERSLQGGDLRVTGDGVQAVRAIVESYAEIIEALPARSMVRCHRLTEKRMQEILHDRRRLGDVVLVGM